MLKEKILLIVLIFSNCKTASYYTNCTEGAPSGNKLVLASECGKYNSSDDSYWCLLYYDLKDQNVQFSLFRNLNERVNLCFGITKDGYYNIEKVKKELRSESGIDTLEINCISSYVKFIYKFIGFLYLML